MRDDSSVGPSSDPLADLLFSLVAVLLLLLLAVLPQIAAGGREPRRSSLAADVTVRGQRAGVLIATVAGVIYGPGPHDRAPLDSILSDPGLTRRLHDLAHKRMDALEVVDAKGLEAAFELESALAREGPPRVLTVRLPRSCADIPAPSLCRIGPDAGAADGG